MKTCFISYCHDNIDRPSLSYLIHLLSEVLGQNAKVFYDQHLPYGKSFKDFMAMLDNVDVVIIILTPPYKTKILERAGGSYEEFQRIWDRYSSQGVGGERTDGSESHFEIVPVLFAGTRSQSTPDALGTLKQLDLTALRVRQKSTGEFIINQHMQSQIRSQIEVLASQIHAIAAVGTSGFAKLSKSYYDRLFVDLKASFNDPAFAGNDYLRNILVKTHSYERIFSQLSYFVVGRKGSGKSTLTQVFPLTNPDRYQSVINIVVNEFNLEGLYSLYSEPQFRSDVNTAVARDRAFEYTWEALLVLGTLQVMQQLAVDKRLTDIQCQLMPPIETFMNEITAQNEWGLDHLFAFAFNKTMAFLRDCIDGARDEASVFLVDIDVRFNRERYLTFVFGREVLDCFRQLVQTFNRRFLVTLDGFDSAFDRFRADAFRAHNEESLRRRTHFEIDWLRSLLQLVVDGKSKSHDYFFAMLDFCISVPQDRFMELNRIERDSYRRWHRWCTLNWSGIELAILVRKRLEVLASYETKQGTSPTERLDEILRHKAFHGLPVEIEFEHNRKMYRMPLFVYILRHTFWRPREVLMYYAALLALAEDMKRWDHEITTEAIRTCIGRRTRQVIESEFLAEFQHTVGNIRAIVDAFRRRPPVIDFATLREIVIPLEFGGSSGDVSSFAQRVQFLYDIGFLGVRSDAPLTQQLRVNHQDAFSFNEGSSLVDGVEESEMSEWEFVIHPIFSEYLKLQSRSHDLTLQFTWDYLYLGDALFSANRAI